MKKIEPLKKPEDYSHLFELSNLETILWERLRRTIDLVNSQQEAIGKLEKPKSEPKFTFDKEELMQVLGKKKQEPADDKPEPFKPIKVKDPETLVQFVGSDTHRTDEEELKSFGNGELRKERELIDTRRQDAFNQLSREKTGVSYDTNEYKWEVNKVATNDTHRTVTLRIPKGMTVGKAIWSANRRFDTYRMSDTDLQKAIDEVEHE